MGPTVQFETSVEKAFHIVTGGLSERGFRVERSFDFQEAASAHPDCACPFHGTADCVCQYLIVIAHPDSVGGGMLTLALHSYDEKTYVSLIEGDENEWINLMVSMLADTTMD
jgi:hypothetical protein